MIKIFLVLISLLIPFSATAPLRAQQMHVHSGAGVSATQLPFWTAKHLGIYAKYGLTVELVAISSGASSRSIANKRKRTMKNTKTPFRPPRVGRRGLAAVLELMRHETGKSKAELDVNRFVDESVLDELEKEGFFKRLQAART